MFLRPTSEKYIAGTYVFSKILITLNVLLFRRRKEAVFA
jgi:hypothetical protein